jgi:hypothetical protein
MFIGETLRWYGKLRNFRAFTRRYKTYLYRENSRKTQTVMDEPYLNLETEQTHLICDSIDNDDDYEDYDILLETRFVSFFKHSCNLSPLSHFILLYPSCELPLQKYLLTQLSPS